MVRMKSFVSRILRRGPVQPSHNPEQLALSYQPNLYQISYGVGTPTGAYYRRLVSGSSVASACKAILIQRISSLGWALSPTDIADPEDPSVKQALNYFDVFFRLGGGTGSFVSLIQSFLHDLLDLPQGAAIEVIPGKEFPVALVPIDGLTIRVTGNAQYPIEQRVGDKVIPLPAERVIHAQYIVRPFFTYNGEGLVPPEISKNAIEMMQNIENYLARVAKGIPSGGILYLGDISRDAASSWVEQMKEAIKEAELVGEVAIPVVYETQQPPRFIPFADPLDGASLQEVIHRATALITSSYGLTVGDLTGREGSSLAGTIREDRMSKRTGEALLRTIIENTFNRLLPPTIHLTLLDRFDDEQQAVNMRAQLSLAMALERLVLSGVLTDVEARQILSETFGYGMFGPVKNDNGTGGTTKRPRSKARGVSGGYATMVGRPVPTTQGGMGEVRVDILNRVSTASDILFRSMYGDVWGNPLTRGFILYDAVNSPILVRSLCSDTGLTEKDVVDALVWMQRRSLGL